MKKYGLCLQMAPLSIAAFAFLQMFLIITLLLTVKELTKFSRLRRGPVNETEAVALKMEKAKFHNLLKTLETEVAVLSTLKSQHSEVHIHHIEVKEQSSSQKMKSKGNFTKVENSGWKFPAVFLGDDTNAEFSERWTSQEGQDRAIAEILKYKKKGYYVDLAANDAVRLSNTLTLEQEFDWDGICIEANVQYVQSLARRRCQLVVAAVGPHDNGKVRFAMNGVYSGIISEGLELDKTMKRRYHSQQVRIRTVTVEKIFADFNVPSVIDYLSLDIEGAEMWAFATFPWHKYRFLTLTVERPGKLAKILRKQGYVYLRDFGNFGDQLWIHESLPNFKEVVYRYNATINGP